MSTLRLAALLGFVGVVLGAFGAHALKGRVEPDLVEVWKTGVLYHMFHALALVAVGVGHDRIGLPRVTAGFFVGGIVIFSGSLYLMTLTGVRWLGAITPVGGLSFMAGWLLLAVTARPIAR